jgi:hypothetical protein
MLENYIVKEVQYLGVVYNGSLSSKNFCQKPL